MYKCWNVLHHSKVVILTSTIAFCHTNAIIQVLESWVVLYYPNVLTPISFNVLSTGYVSRLTNVPLMSIHFTTHILWIFISQMASEKRYMCIYKRKKVFDMKIISMTLIKFMAACIEVRTLRQFWYRCIYKIMDYSVAEIAAPATAAVSVNVTTNGNDIHSENWFYISRLTMWNEAMEFNSKRPILNYWNFRNENDFHPRPSTFLFSISMHASSLSLSQFAIRFYFNLILNLNSVRWVRMQTSAKY